MRICSLSVPPLKHEWNQTVWSVNNLRCGTADKTEQNGQNGKRIVRPHALGLAL
jgi:hypothetical protein